jgi:hypothetical protein
MLLDIISAQNYMNISDFQEHEMKIFLQRKGDGISRINIKPGDLEITGFSCNFAE